MQMQGKAKGHMRIGRKATAGNLEQMREVWGGKQLRGKYVQAPKVTHQWKTNGQVTRKISAVSKIVVGAACKQVRGMDVCIVQRKHRVGPREAIHLGNLRASSIP